MGSERLQRTGSIELALERRYARIGVRYLYEVIGMFAGWVLVVYALAVVGVTIYLHGSVGDYGLLLVVAVALTLVGAAVSLGVWRAGSRFLIEWMDGTRSAEAAAGAWSTALDLPVRLPVVAFIVAFPFNVGYSFFAADVLGSGLASVPVILLGSVTATWIGAGGPAIFGFQLAMRPVLRELAEQLPADTPIASSRFGLAQQLVGRLAVVGVCMSMASGAAVAASGDRLARLALGLTVAPVLMLIVGAFVFPILVVSLLGPVNELLAASRRVGAGDLTAEVPVVTADELGELSRSFNEMTAGLRLMTADLRESRARIVVAADESRRRVERDLHDGAQQHLVLIGLKLGLARRQVEQDPAAAAATIDDLRQDLDRALRELRELAHGIYPAVLANEGLAAALREAAQLAAIPVKLNCNGAGRYLPEVEAAVYFCCLEAMQNAAKHAGPGARVMVGLTERDRMIRFAVTDDGTGYDPATTPGSAGQQNMIDRVGALAGNLRVNSKPGHGTTVEGAVPLDR
jgi:signal transduction histidine kinase